MISSIELMLGSSSLRFSLAYSDRPLFPSHTVRRVTILYRLESIYFRFSTSDDEPTNQGILEVAEKVWPPSRDEEIPQVLLFGVFWIERG